ncbi:MAG: hypothetical protein ACTHZ5_13930 [Micrococcaceae bacterium]
MTITPRRCIIWAAVCFAVATLLSLWLPDLLHWLSTGALRNDTAVTVLIEFAVRFVNWTLMPVGGALVTAAVVITWLDRRDREERSAREAVTDSTGPAPRP